MFVEQEASSSEESPVYARNACGAAKDAGARLIVVVRSNMRRFLLPACRSSVSTKLREKSGKA